MLALCLTKIYLLKENYIFHRNLALLSDTRNLLVVVTVGQDLRQSFLYRLFTLQCIYIAKCYLKNQCETVQSSFGYFAWGSTNIVFVFGMCVPNLKNWRSFQILSYLFSHNYDLMYFRINYNANYYQFRSFKECFFGSSEIG